MIKTRITDIPSLLFSEFRKRLEPYKVTTTHKQGRRKALVIFGLGVEIDIEIVNEKFRVTLVGTEFGYNNPIYFTPEAPMESPDFNPHQMIDKIMELINYIAGIRKFGDQKLDSRQPVNVIRIRRNISDKLYKIMDQYDLERYSIGVSSIKHNEVAVYVFIVKNGLGADIRVGRYEGFLNDKDELVLDFTGYDNNDLLTDEKKTITLPELQAQMLAIIEERAKGKVSLVKRTTK